MKRPSNPILLSLLLLCAVSPLSRAQGWVVAEGGGLGGSPTYMADLFSFMVEKCGHDKPKVAIIGAVPLDKDERFDAFKKAGASDVTSLIITEANADSQEIYDQLSAVDIIFIRGGDQGRYVNWWRGKKTEAAIKAVFARGGVVSGSSAGCAIMGEWTYDAIKDGLSPREALSDARHPNLTITHGFLGLVPGVMFDTHFTERGRLPRTIVMLARIASTRMNGWTDQESKGFTGCESVREADLAPHWADRPMGEMPTPRSLTPLAIGVDPRTAICVGPDHVALVKGQGTATLLRLSDDSTIVSTLGQPPSVNNVHYSQLLPGTTFNTQTGEILARPPAATFSPSIQTPVRQIVGPVPLDGSSLDDAKLGTLYVSNAERREAEKAEDAGHKRADATLAEGSSKLPLVATTSAWKKRHPQWAFALSEHALATHPGMIALFLDEGCSLTIHNLGVVHVSPSEGKVPTSLVVLDSRNSHFVGIEEASPPRTHLEDAIVTIVAPGQIFDLASGLMHATDSK